MSRDMISIDPAAMKHLEIVRVPRQCEGTGEYD